MAAQEYSWAKIVSLNSIANQRRAQLTKVPLFEVLKFRWGQWCRFLVTFHVIVFEPVC